MSLLTWNCRGLGNPRSVRILRNLTKEKNPFLVFLMETKSRKQKLEEVRLQLQMYGCFAVDSVNLSGGIALLWREEWQVKVISYTKWHISALVHEVETGQAWQFTGFYGHPVTAKRKSSWTLLEMLKPSNPTAWLCAGDFNEILDQKEKVGGARRPYSQIEDFRRAVEACDLSDIHSQGPQFTWSNNRSGGDFTKERLDRVMANKEWNLMFSDATCSVLAAVKSDHSPLHVTKQKPNSGRKRKGFCFRYEAAWDLSEECQKVASEGWKSLNLGGHGAGTVRHKLDACQRGLQKWQKETKFSNQKATKLALDQIRQYQQVGTGTHIPSMIQLQKTVEDSMAVEELRWRQRAKQHWL
ncbi:uncharacterized protein LOC122301806 [Carya illinoinensis]|uniref:uncharacterized protein LOC122301806 n=1 Tax=Carya illinoinensis TaxID=32201 RepID=UPI001C7235DA|nr:uncharacterized protein LOC122301806 [Carya illinoinensis]